MICSVCGKYVSCYGEFKLWQHEDGGLMCEDGEAIQPLKVLHYMGEDYELSVSPATPVELRTKEE